MGYLLLITFSASREDLSIFLSTHPNVHLLKSNINNFRRNKHGSRTTTAPTPPLEESNPQRRFKPKPIAPSVVQAQNDQNENSPIYKFKLNRSPGRWQYKTSPKPRVVIKKTEKAIEDENIQIISASQNEADINSNDVLSNKNDSDLEPEGRPNEFNTQIAGTPKYLAETLKVEISTPADFKDTYYEIATIKTPYTFRVSLSSSYRKIDNIDILLGRIGGKHSLCNSNLYF